MPHQQYGLEMKTENNIFIVDPLIHKDLIIEHYKNLNREDQMLRFNGFLSEDSILIYINFIQKNNTFLLGYIINNKIIGLCEISKSKKNKNSCDLAISVLNEYRRKNIGKHLVYYSACFAYKLSYLTIVADISFKNKIIKKWLNSYSFISVSKKYNDLYIEFKTINGNIEQIRKY